MEARIKHIGMEEAHDAFRAIVWTALYGPLCARCLYMGAVASNMLAGRDYAEDFELPNVCQEFCPVNPGAPWYIHVEESDLAAAYHVIRQGLSFANNPVQADHPMAQRRVPSATDVKVRWTLARDIHAREYVIGFNYTWPIFISLQDQGELAGYAAPAINIARTGFAGDDVNPRRYVVHLRWLPYPALPLAKSKCFYFYPEPTIHLMERGMDHDETKAAGRARAKPGMLRKLGSYVGLVKDEMELDEEAVRKERGEPPGKKRKIDEV